MENVEETFIKECQKCAYDKYFLLNSAFVLQLQIQYLPTIFAGVNYKSEYSAQKPLDFL